MRDLLSVSASATQSYKRALNAVQTNISNLNTEGYSRQKVSITSTGESHTTLTRAHDSFAEGALRSANSSLEFEQPGTDYARRLLNLVGSDSGSLTTAFDQFFSSAKQLAANPSSASSRQDFLSNAGYLAARVNAVASELQEISADNNAEVEYRINQLNGFSSQLAVVNEELADFSGANVPPALLDKRDLVLMKISGLAKIDVTISEKGLASVSLASPNGSVALVSNTESKTLSVSPVTGEKNMQQIKYIGGAGVSADLTTVTGGSIGGLLSAKSSIIDPLVSKLNSMTQTLATRLNEQHAQGMSSLGVVGANMFSLGSDTNYAENFTLALTSSDQIAAAGRLKIAPGASNSENLRATLSYGENTSWGGTVEGSFTITFTSPTAYSVTTGGVTTNYTGFDINNGIVIGDVKVNFDRAPAASDTFAVTSNISGIGDNSNITRISEISEESIFESKKLRDFYINEIGKVSSFNNLSKMSAEAKQAVYDNALTAKDKISGVNLDEEAADLIRLQQAYMATAKAMQTASDIFQQLLRIGI